MVLVDLHSKPSLMGLRSTQDDVRFSGSAQGAVVGHTGSPNPNVDYDAPAGSGLLYNTHGGRRKRVNGRKSRKSRKGRKPRKGHKSRKSRKQHASLRRRTKKGGFYVSSNPSSVNYLVGKSAGHPEFSRDVNAGYNAPHKLGAGIQHPCMQKAQHGAGGASLYPSQFGNTYYSTSMDDTAVLRGSYPEVVGKTHGCQGGGKRRSRKIRKIRKSRKSKRVNRRKLRKSRKSRRHGRNKKGGYHQYLNGSARSFGYLTNGKLQPHQSALAGHGLMGAYKMGDYGFKGNYNHFTGKNT